MGLFTSRSITFPPPQDLIPRRTARPNRLVTQDTAFHISAVWAALRIRADLISTFPVDVYRRVGNAQIETSKPYVLNFPGGPNCSMQEWLYASQIDLDRTGNCFGLISQRDSLGLPARIDLIPATDVAVVIRGGELIGFRIKGTVFDPSEVWHEKQYSIPGLHVGLSPVAYASWSMGIYASLDQFIVEFLDNATTPSVVMKNNAQRLNDVQAKEMKDKWRATVQNGDALILGADWDFQPFVAEQTGLNWLQAKQYTVEDIARFFNVPHDLLDISSSGSSGNAKMTYANIGQRNLQFLMFNLLPSIRRREEAFSNYLLPGTATGGDARSNRYVKFNTDSLFQMDPTSQAALFASQIAAGIRTPTEARELMNLPPLTPAQIKEIQTAQGAGQPPEPIVNPGAKGLSKRAQRDYMPIGADSPGPYDSGNGTFMASQDTSHCTECCPQRALQGSTEIQMDAGACDCAAGCPCNPIGMGCIYPAGSCVCGCGEDQEAATPTYTPNYPTDVKPDALTGPANLPARSEEHKCPDNIFHIHVPEREVTVMPAEVNVRAGDVHVDIENPETNIRIIEE